MADKTKAEVQALVDAMVALLEAAETTGASLLTLLAAITTAIDAGDDQPEDDAQYRAVAKVKSTFVSHYNACVALFRTLHPTLGRYSGSTDLANRLVNLQAFHDKLIADAESIKSRGLTKFSSWSAAGGNTGDGVFSVYNVDVDGTSMDISHAETLTARCTKGVADGATARGGEFEIIGEAHSDEAWTEGGSGTGRAYDRQHGISSSTHDWNPNVKKLSGRKIKSVGGSKASGNILANGDFEGTFGSSGTAKVPSWTLDSNHANADKETTSPVKGDQSLKITGNVVATQSLVGNSKIRTGQAYRLDAVAWVDNTSLTSATLTVKILDDSTTHATITQDLTALTDETITRLTGVSFVLPRTVGENLRAEIAVASYVGSGDIRVDEVVLQEMQLYDGGRAVSITTGLADWVKGDSATGATTTTDAGTIQKALNRHENFWVEHAGVAVGGW